MQKRIGIWIDNRKALIVTLTAVGGEAAIREIASDVERHVRLSGGSRSKRTPWGPQQVSSDNTMEARHQQQLRRFYQNVIEAIGDAYKVMLMGPGEAKLGLKKEIEKIKGLSDTLVHIETCDKMTQRQIVAHIKSFFESVP